MGHKREIQAQHFLESDFIKLDELFDSCSNLCISYVYIEFIIFMINNVRPKKIILEGHDISFSTIKWDFKNFGVLNP